MESAEIGAGRASGLELMERAGGGVVEAIFATWPELAAAPRSALVLSGPGNNGGDGFVVARMLRARGWQVRLALLGDATRLPQDARANHDRWLELGGCERLDASILDDVAVSGAAAPDLVVDALFGTGLTRPLEGELAMLLGRLEPLRVDAGTKVVAVDIPSGLCSDSGRVLGHAVFADLTVSFHTAKLGHYLGAAEEHCGRLVVHDIGLPQTAGRGAVCLLRAPRAEVLAKPSVGHKYTQGHALVLTGGAGHTGAARLAARAALRVGAGLVTLGVPQSAMEEVAAQITALMMVEVVDFAALRSVLEDRRFNALCLGPGLGVTQHSRALVEVALAAGRATVLDADALSLFRDGPEELFELLHSDCVLTPHGGEFARIFPDLARRLAAPAQHGPAYSAVDAARAAAERAGCVVLLKGRSTVIAAPDGRCAIHAAIYDRSAPWLATAGAGDVLAGLITGLLARGLPPMQAAGTAAWLHVEAARRFGPGLIAEDLPETLPQVFRDLGL
ncbi:bifunctional NAD(P)H-hydrate repair enzyme [Pseudodonghicola xiamenensis]|uniref:Bifunctional NAD(P)H-hydrate repair enzyme n=1 Tax=Pseudodonghicola xiamenensis TaxID=337702 RepID=A0A8J3MF80_9RHOB|nr:bifunctional NAD(P)H-hydrate repair enzyme [Pseudodonghicola xiamenensis]